MSIGGDKSISGDVRYAFRNYEVKKLDLPGVDELDADFFSLQIGLTFNF
jgi:hypothetical protein